MSNDDTQQQTDDQFTPLEPDEDALLAETGDAEPMHLGNFTTDAQDEGEA